MPVTFYPCDKKLESVYRTTYKPKEETDLIVSSGSVDGQKCLTSVFAAAYDDHNHLYITPDSIWLTIMTQFATYLEKYAEALRSKFVDFEGQRTLTVYDNGTLRTANYPSLIKAMVDQIGKHIKDQTVAKWAVPDFTTTTETDRTVGSLLLMSAMKKFFSYKMCLCCGLPVVTLMGTPDDWRQVRTRAARLLEFDTDQKYMSLWHKVLDGVLEQFVVSAEGNPNLGWWNQISNVQGGGSGPSYYSGWLTVFSIFGNNGVWYGNPVPTAWPVIDTDEMHSGIVTVNVTIDDNGEKHETFFTAGVSGFMILHSTGIMPVSQWKLSKVKKIVNNIYDDTEDEAEAEA